MGEPKVGQVLSVETMDEGLRLVRDEPVDVAFVDLSLAAGPGRPRWHEFREACPRVPIVGFLDPGTPPRDHAQLTRAAEENNILLLSEARSPQVKQVMVAAMERKRIERQVGFLVDLFERLEYTSTLNEALALALEEVCQFAQWLLAEAWVPTGDGGALRLSHVWSAGDEAVERFVQSSQGMQFDRGEGLPGAVWESGHARTLWELNDPEHFVRSEAARKAGIRSGMAVPIPDGDSTLGVLVFFMGEHRAPDEASVLLARGVARQLGSVVRRQRDRVRIEEQLRELEQSAAIQNAILSSMLEHIYLFAPDMRYLYASPAGARALGMEPGDIVGRTWRQVGLPASLMEPFEEEVRSVFATRRPLRGELTFPVVSGEGRYNYILTPVRGPGDSVDMVTCTVRDETHSPQMLRGLPRVKGQPLGET